MIVTPWNVAVPQIYSMDTETCNTPESVSLLNRVSQRNIPVRP
jgi:hypothetical protein